MAIIFRKYDRERLIEVVHVNIILGVLEKVSKQLLLMPDVFRTRTDTLTTTHTHSTAYFIMVPKALRGWC